MYVCVCAVSVPLKRDVDMSRIVVELQVAYLLLCQSGVCYRCVHAGWRGGVFGCSRTCDRSAVGLYHIDGLPQKWDASLLMVPH